ncbi:hypothetical protein BDF19DRAFT_56456 [Syncephalis fuscata]|nr:hypothetical protein BDF19DRAFT_56456 [Syncephalis fuscata]
MPEITVKYCQSIVRPRTCIMDRYINDISVVGLYSEKLIVVEKNAAFDVLDARNGDLLRSIDGPYYSRVIPFLGSLCGLISPKHKESWFVDMRTGRIYDPPTSLTNRQVEEDKEHIPLGPVEITQFPPPNKSPFSDFIEYKASTVVVGRVNEKDARVYEAYML